MEPDARAAAAKRKLKRASGLLRDAGRDLAAAAGDTEALGSFEIRDRRDCDRVAEALRAALLTRGALTVHLVSARPPQPPRPRQG